MATKRKTKAEPQYRKIDASEIPADVTFTTPRQNQGQIVTVSYGGFGRGPWDEGDPFMHVSDASDGTDDYYQLER